MDEDPFNESINLKQAAEDYKARFGYYPEAILADQIYHNLETTELLAKRKVFVSVDRGNSYKKG